MQGGTRMSPSAGNSSAADFGFDPAAVEQLAARMMADISSALASILCALGLRLGIFAHMSANGPTTSEELAAASGLDQRYLTEWLRAMAAAGYLDADREEKRF